MNRIGDDLWPFDDATVHRSVPVDPINVDIKTMFSSDAGRRVLEWLIEQHLMRPTAFLMNEQLREAEGKRNLIVNLLMRMKRAERS